MLSLGGPTLKKSTRIQGLALMCEWMAGKSVLKDFKYSGKVLQRQKDEQLVGKLITKSRHESKPKKVLVH